jgi:Rps23 Pro-64 3,4-dihydroxylase Tpa1-like proline 4-hydroxylase
MIQRFENFLDENSFNEVSNILTKLPLKFGIVSTDSTLPIFQNEADSKDCDLIAKHLLNILNTKVEIDFELLFYHLNVQPQGLDGSFHKDNLNGVSHAFSFYCSPIEWESTYGGWLLLDHSENADVCTAILPQRNSAVLHDANISHCALSPNNRAGTLIRYSFTMFLRELK